jgi:glycosyltransferase involved in cell wall biosynthesis
MSTSTTQLVVFADAWGVHPSSHQHLVRNLGVDYSILWVNTVGTRRPTLNAADLRKAVRHLATACKSGPKTRPRVVAPLMWPGFRSAWQRRLNAALIARTVHQALGPRGGERRIALTTIPITADLVGRLDVDEWVYYCVDEFPAWPGLDGDVLRTMDTRQVSRVDRLIAASHRLQMYVRRLGRESALLTLGVDLEHWVLPTRSAAPNWLAHVQRPIWMFWGLIDERLDVGWCRLLANGAAGPGTLVLVGPGSLPEPLRARVVAPGSISYEALPAVAAAADVLVLPYVDAPVTRAAQPLKLKEYLATGKPVVARDLPATREWADASDVVCNEIDFVRAVRQRGASRTPTAQIAARTRLRGESWQSKARQLERILLGGVA